MWRDVLARHKASPLHLAVGGGDQIYNDAVFSGPLLGSFDKASTDAETAERLAAPLTEAMRREMEQYYLAHYCLHFAEVGPPAHCRGGAACTLPRWGRLHVAEAGPPARCRGGAACTLPRWGRLHIAEVGPPAHCRGGAVRLE
eukprot:366387-Chlamydomonas_euryale.AAC.34